MSIQGLLIALGVGYNFMASSKGKENSPIDIP